MIGLRKFGLVPADARGRGTRDDFLRASSCEAIRNLEDKFSTGTLC